MSIASKPKIIAIVGPTASGKSTLAVRIALRLGSKRAKKRFGINGAEVVSADSRQVYRGMDIGTGKITKKEMRGIPHHLLDVASPKKNFTVVDFQRLARRAIKKIFAKGKIPILCGGTGFYIDAALYDYALPNVKANSRLRRVLEKQSAEALFIKLQKLDPERAARIDCHNKRRLVRALEIIAATKKPIPSPEDALRKTSGYEILKIGIALPPQTLKANIHKRLLVRMRHGMIAEAGRLRKNGVSSKRLDDLGLEYRFVNRYLEGLLTRERMIVELEKAIWHYAKRQMTWFRRDAAIRWTKNEIRALSSVKLFLTS